MSKPIEDVRAQAEVVARARTEEKPEAERELLRLLGLVMKQEESSFDPAHGFARIMDATDQHHEVRLFTDGSWRIGASPEDDLLGTWSNPGRPTLAALLDAIPKKFSSAKVGALVTELRVTLGV